MRNSSHEVAPSSTGGGVFETSVEDDVLPVVVAGRKLNVVNVETVIVAVGSSVELEDVGSSLDGYPEGCSLDLVVSRVEAANHDVVPEDVAP